jgi:peptidoglycan/xylan/chitin deacetylase (PgdA/CDA1 family)
LIRRIPLFWDLLVEALQTEKRDEIIVKLESPLDRTYPLRTKEDMKTFVLEINQYVLTLNGERQMEVFKTLFGSKADTVIARTRGLYLGPEEVKGCLKVGIEFGGHSASHPYLPFLSVTQWDKEILGAKAELESFIGKEVPFFSYPAGKWNKELRDYLGRSGFQGALATGKRAVGVKEEDLFSLPRISPEGVSAMGKFFSLVSGVKKEWFE